MGFHLQQVRVLVDMYARGGPLGETLTIGRQFLFVRPDDVARVMRRRGLFNTNESARFSAFRSADNAYAEPFLRFLGATRVESIDASDYEQATRIHDLHCPIPSEWHQEFDTVIDRGTLEHVFNFPVAIQSLMHSPRVGGRLVLLGPANSQCGHGFYQFSPEVFFLHFSRHATATGWTGFCLLRISPQAKLLKWLTRPQLT